MTKVKKIIKLLKETNKQVLFIAFVLTLAIAYYINPLSGVDLVEWDRTFSTATLSGISIDARIGNFYKLFFLYLPGIAIVLICLLNWLFYNRKKYINIYFKLSTVLVFAVSASYISRYFSKNTDIVSNPLMECLLAFFAILTIICILDKTERFKFADISMLLVIFVVLVLTFNMMFRMLGMTTCILICSVILIGYISVVLFVPVGQEAYEQNKKYIFFLMWLPAVIRIVLEGIYFLTEKGWGVQRYFTLIGIACIAFLSVALIAVILLRKQERGFSTFGYIGAIVSIAVVNNFAYNYQYIWSYDTFANVYEKGNNAVTVDSILHGKLPIFDYFSAHALNDVWTRIIYCLIHDDIKGIFADPYGGLTAMIAYIILFFIVKKLFDKNIAVLYVLLFPGILTGIKWMSLCGISIAALLYIYKNPTVKKYVVFWCAALIGVFITYDEGMSLGVACILAHVVFLLIQRKIKLLKKFVFCGAGVGIGALIFYVIYACATGIPVMGRIKEWMSVSLSSSSTWATAEFGDQSSFAFLLSYIVVPITAILLVVFTLFKYYKTRKNGRVALLTTVFAFAEILYITRTIVYHNLAVCSGRTGVLLNFIHWTVALYVLYTMSVRGRKQRNKVLAWMGTMMIVILVEGTAVTQSWPQADSILVSRSLKASENWDLRDDVTENVGQPRIVFDESTTLLVKQFEFVFDTLLEEDETFVDFANVTSMYALTGRERPSYVGQTPSLLTDLYSQKCYLREISEYSCPLAILGTTETSYLQQMVGVPHNIRYYKIAEYIYNKYRPLIRFGEFVIWCETDKYDEYKLILQNNKYDENIYELVDYGYDFTTSFVDEKGNVGFLFKPYHSYNLNMLPYIWANYDKYAAIDNKKIISVNSTGDNQFRFEGSQTTTGEQGNYLAFEIMNSSEENKSVNIVLYDSQKEGAKMQYCFEAVPGTNQYMIRVSADYFWDIYNIDTILFNDDEQLIIKDVRVLEGD